MTIISLCCHHNPCPQHLVILSCYQTKHELKFIFCVTSKYCIVVTLMVHVTWIEDHYNWNFNFKLATFYYNICNDAKYLFNEMHLDWNMYLMKCLDTLWMQVIKLNYMLIKLIKQTIVHVNKVNKANNCAFYIFRNQIKHLHCIRYYVTMLAFNL